MLIAGTISAFSQQPFFQPELRIKNDKLTHVFIPKRTADISLFTKITGDSLQCGIREINGQLIGVSSDHILIQPLTEKQTTKDLLNVKKTVEYNYCEFPTTIPIEKNKIYRIAHHSNSQENSMKAGGIMLGVGLFTSLILAPLVSFNYNTGAFNTSRYFWFAGTGLGLITISIPLLASYKARTFDIGKNPGNTSNYWEIE
jgi:hypothetical protein